MITSWLLSADVDAAADALAEVQELRTTSQRDVARQAVGGVESQFHAEHEFRVVAADPICVSTISTDREPRPDRECRATVNRCDRLLTLFQFWKFCRAKALKSPEKFQRR